MLLCAVCCVQRAACAVYVWHHASPPFADVLLLQGCEDWEEKGLEVVEAVKKDFDEHLEPHWHVIIGKNFGSFVTHETKKFLYFYVGDKAVMVFKAG